jgi:hypothetical protein
MRLPRFSRQDILAVMIFIAILLLVLSYKITPEPLLYETF